ncbi:hypothetical protein POSPLADRAFT_1047989 [Postia placenta MAD-698-R-SB12]|uniref:Cyclin N-terminal domain-containing protein n=1 Tax=Postia placenta MAD-698-R-SB12 TaxID=670580 RepID=A0A1X6MW57_9APHY|nr:hypothetical protein POSPLADRAFT_1047989 [Postia placenta MAD-698-R-SB12]OSX60579.1 hypothetical protein POSPLADRAFT_1047989 [Postia placenta MAD-698-R-SB12]
MFSCVPSSIDPSSQVTFASRSPFLSELLAIPVNWDLIDHVVEAVRYTTLNPTRRLKNALFINFVKLVVVKTRIDTANILVALTIIDKVCQNIGDMRRDWECEELFIASLILAHKATSASVFFDLQDINRLERELLDVIKFDLCITEEAILRHFLSLRQYCIEEPSSRYKRSGAGSSRTSLRDTGMSQRHVIPFTGVESPSPVNLVIPIRRSTCSFPSCRGNCSPSLWADSPALITPVNIMPMPADSDSRYLQGMTLSRTSIQDRVQHASQYIPAWVDKCSSRQLGPPTELFPAEMEPHRWQPPYGKWDSAMV